MLRVLCACEESQAVTIEFRRFGVEAYSCDVEPCSGRRPEWHLQGDVIPLLTWGWDLIIAFPPCTDLTCACSSLWPQKQKDGRQPAAIEFFMRFVNAPCRYIAVENPQGIINTVYRKPDQVVQPYEFGDPYSKRTCLWLKNLPLLKPTKLVSRGEFTVYPSGRRAAWRDKIGRLPASERSRLRSKTFPGIARAMAEQWTAFLLWNL